MQNLQNLIPVQLHLIVMIRKKTTKTLFEQYQGHPSGQCRESRLTDPPDVVKATAIRSGLLFNFST